MASSSQGRRLREGAMRAERLLLMVPGCSPGCCIPGAPALGQEERPKRETEKSWRKVSLAPLFAAAAWDADQAVQEAAPGRCSKRR